MNSESRAVVPAAAISGQELKAYLERARRENVSLWELLEEERQINEDGLADAFSAWLRIPRVRIASANIDPEAVRALGKERAQKYCCLPLKVERKALILAIANPADFSAIQDLQFATGYEIRAVVASRTEILDGIERHYNPDDQLQDFLANVADATDLHILPQEKEVALDPTDVTQAELPPVVKMCNLVIQDAIKQSASDVHIEPTLNSVQVRLRIDGMLRDYMQVPKWLHNAVVSRLKILAKLDIAERRVPQDGRIKIQIQKRSLDLRVSTLPTHFGEKVVMRVLGSSELPGLDKLGFSPVQRSLLETALSQPQGMILVTGPTGSGKSTALYAMLNQRKSPEVNIVTVEDPIEYQLAGINQVQVNTRAGLTFAACLRSILRQDPDIILVGEIRDLETAEIGFQASMTGHLVLSTLHTNSAVATIGRLLDMGVDPYLIASSVNLIAAQRLARRICLKCREEYEPSSQILEKLRLEEPETKFYRGRGCPACGGTGYAGRVGIYELVRVTPTIKRLINMKASEADLRKAAGIAGTRFLLDDAIDKVRSGITTLEEVLRVIQLQESEIIRCPQCNSFINLDFATCPYCLYTLKNVCASCGQEVKLEWKICPYCNTRTNFEQLAAQPAPLPAASAAPIAPAERKPEPRLEPKELEAPRESEIDLESAEEPQSETMQKRIRILVVDDDAGIRKVIHKTLEQLPGEVDIIEAPDGAEALELMEQNVADLVITDIMMPRMDGFTLCERLRKGIRTAFVPIMMLTASADEASRTKGFILGTDDFVGKPFNIPEFTARVTRLLRRTYGL